MFNLSGSEIVVILLLALVVLGPEKLPDALRRAGRTYAELKKMGNSFQAEVKSALDEPMKEMQETADLMRKATDFTGEPDVAPALRGPSFDTGGSSRRGRHRRAGRSRSRRSTNSSSTRRSVAA